MLFWFFRGCLVVVFMLCRRRVVVFDRIMRGFLAKIKKALVGPSISAVSQLAIQGFTLSRLFRGCLGAVAAVAVVAAAAVAVTVALRRAWGRRSPNYEALRCLSPVPCRYIFSVLLFDNPTSRNTYTFPYSKIAQLSF